MKFSLFEFEKLIVVPYVVYVWGFVNLPEFCNIQP